MDDIFLERKCVKGPFQSRLYDGHPQGRVLVVEIVDDDRYVRSTCSEQGDRRDQITQGVENLELGFLGIPGFGILPARADLKYAPVVQIGRDVGRMARERVENQREARHAVDSVCVCARLCVCKMKKKKTE